VDRPGHVPANEFFVELFSRTAMLLNLYFQALNFLVRNYQGYDQLKFQIKDAGYLLVRDGAFFNTLFPIIPLRPTLFFTLSNLN